MIYLQVLLLLCILLLPQRVSAQNLDELSSRLTGLDSKINALSDEYSKEEKSNEQRLERIELTRNGTDSKVLEQELKVAYTSAEKLSRINLELNKLNEDKRASCRQWQAAYRKTIDELLTMAEKEKDQKERVQIGRKLQTYQRVNAGLCPQGLEKVLSQDWRQLKIQPYDGPQEIHQKISLLNDLSREIKIRLAHLESYYQESIQEHRIKERAQEFIQEGTLFDSSNLRTSRSSATNPGDGSTIPTSERPDGGFSQGGPTSGGATGGITGSTSTPQQEMSTSDWGTASVEQIEVDYKKLKNALLDQQTGLQQKISEFENKATTLLKQ